MKGDKEYKIYEVFQKFREHSALVAIRNNDSGIELSYEELLLNIHKNIEVLKKEIKPGDRVILYDIEGENWVVNFWAIISIGAIVVPVDTRLRADAIKSVLNTTSPKLIISNNDLNTFNGQLVRKPLAIEKDKTIQLESLKFEIDQNKPAVIALTSGSWSEPKGATLSVNNILSNALATKDSHSPTSQDVFLSILPLAHMYELTVGMIIPLLAGSKIVYINEIIARNIIGAIQANQVTYIVGVPRILELFKTGISKKIKSKKIRDAIFSFVKFSRIFPIEVRRILFKFITKNFGASLKTFVIGGAPLSLDTDHFFQGLGYKVFIGYGLSETSPVISISLDQDRQDKEVGKIIKNLEHKISDDGELIVKGQGVFLGYWPELKVDEYFETGDLAQIVNDRLILLGRKKNLMVFPTGDKIYLEDIESLINKFEYIEESAAIPVDNNEVDLIVVLNKNKKIKATEIEKVLPIFVRIRNIYVTSNELPKTHTLKLKRGEIKKLHNDFLTKESHAGA